MAGLELRVKVHGAKQFSRSLDRVARYIGRDRRPIYKEIMAWWYEHQEQQFDSEGAHITSTWAQLGAIADGGPPGSYGRWKAKHYPEKPLLELSGDLRRAMTGKSGRAFKSLKKTHLKLGVRDVPYWRTHQYGRRRRNIPKRPMVGITKEMQVDLDKRMQALLASAMRKILRDVGGPGGMAR